MNGGDNRPEFTHELAAGGAAFFAAREYEKHCDANGKPSSHAKAKEILYVVLLLSASISDTIASAALTGGFIDRIVETKGVRAVFHLQS